MFKFQANSLRIDLKLEPLTPLLVKSGDKGGTLLHPERPDMMFVRTGPRGSETVFIPGASIKGVVRSASERILTTLGARCCDPLNQRTSACNKEAAKLGEALSKDPAGATDAAHPMGDVHKMLCYACRVFGSQAMKGRMAFGDALPPAKDSGRTNETERRSGVAISRQTGGPSRGKLFDLEAVTGGSFESSIHMTNFQLWQVALLGIVLREIQEGWVRFGSAKTRGFGHIRPVIQRVLFEQIDPTFARTSPCGVAALRPEAASAYGLVPAGDLLPQYKGCPVQATPLGQKWAMESPTETQSFLDACMGEPWKEFIRHVRGS